MARNDNSSKVIGEGVAELREISGGGLDAAIARIQGTAVKAQGFHSLGGGKNPHERRFLLPTTNEDGGCVIDVVTEDHPPRDHMVYDIDSLSKWSEGENDVVWHSDNEVVLVLDDTTYRESRVSMPLPEHPAFGALCKLEKMSPQTQKEMIQFLRLNLKAEIDAAAPSFVASLREIRIQSNSAGTGSVQAGRETMGRQIDESVTGANIMPEDLLIRVQLWLHHACTVDVDCTFDIDVSKATFSLKPKPGQLDIARASGQKWLHEQLGNACTHAAVYFGTPNEDGND